MIKTDHDDITEMLFKVVLYTNVHH